MIEKTGRPIAYGGTPLLYLLFVLVSRGLPRQLYLLLFLFTLNMGMNSWTELPVQVGIKRLVRHEESDCQKQQEQAI